MDNFHERNQLTEELEEVLFLERQLLECKFCNQKALMHVDDEGSFGGMGMPWDHYICKVCFSEKDVSVKCDTEIIKWTKRHEFVVRTDDDAREFYRSSVS